MTVFIDDLRGDPSHFQLYIQIAAMKEATQVALHLALPRAGLRLRKTLDDQIPAGCPALLRKSSVLMMGLVPTMKNYPFRAQKLLIESASLRV